MTILMESENNLILQISVRYNSPSVTMRIFLSLGRYMIFQENIISQCKLMFLNCNNLYPQLRYEVQISHNNLSNELVHITEKEPFIIIYSWFWPCISQNVALCTSIILNTIRFKLGMASDIFLNLANVKITNHEKRNYNTFSKMYFMVLN
jgi:hypothetical protein